MNPKTTDPPRLTIADLARSLNVSAATVSNALNGKGNLSEQTRRRVLAAVASSGYRPSHAAVALRTGRTQTLGLVLPNITNPVFPLMAQEIEREASARGQAVILMDSQGDLDKQARALSSLHGREVDAIILVACRGTRAQDVPPGVILIDAPSNPRSDVSSDHLGGGRLAVRHLLDLGHTRITVLAGPENSVVARERSEGGRAALREARLDPVEVHHSGYGLAEGERYARERFRAGQATAIYAVSDSLAAGVVRGLTASGLRVPGDVSVMGFDGIVWGELLTPPLSTIRQDVPALALAALRLALGEEGEVPRVVPVELVPRQSTSPPPR